MNGWTSEVHAVHPAARWHGGPAAGFFGNSATVASVVMRSAATEAAFWIATRTTLVGSMMPLGDEVAVLAGLAVEAERVLILLQDLADDDGAVLARVDRDLAGRGRQRTRMCATICAFPRAGLPFD
jgi:hypothetical protein